MITRFISLHFNCGIKEKRWEKCFGQMDDLLKYAFDIEHNCVSLFLSLFRLERSLDRWKNPRKMPDSGRMTLKYALLCENVI